MGAPLPFVAAMLFATFTLKMPAPPPFAVVVVLALLLALLPLAFAGIAGVLSQYPYLMVGFVGLVLFHAFRLQAAPKTALVGVLLQTFAIMLPIATGQSEQAAARSPGHSRSTASWPSPASTSPSRCSRPFASPPGRLLRRRRSTRWSGRATPPSRRW